MFYYLVIVTHAISEDAAFARMAALCSTSEHCESDMRQRLCRADLPTSVVQAIIDRLYDEGFLDTARYCRAYASDQMRFARWGPIKIAASLRQKGLPADDIREAVAALPDDEYHEILISLLRAKARQTSEPTREKLLRFAASRGFTYEAAEQALAAIDDD